MLDMLYINDKTKTLLHFSIAGKSFSALYKELGHTQKTVDAVSYHFESMVSQFGKEVEFPACFVEELSEEEMDVLMLYIEYNDTRLFKEHFFALIPYEYVRLFSDNETLNTYCTFGVNREAILIKSENAISTHLAAATHGEFMERFELLGRVA